VISEGHLQAHSPPPGVAAAISTLAAGPSGQARRPRGVAASAHRSFPLDVTERFAHSEYEPLRYMPCGTCGELRICRAAGQTG
jgi:hypothetical protein